MSASLENALRTVFAAPNRIQQNEWEITTFLNRVRIELKPERTVELGTWRGANASLLSLVTSVKTVSLDCTDYGGLDFDMPSQNLIKLIRDGHNPATAKEVSAMLGAPIDLLFIDDGHCIHEVTADWNVWSPLVRKGGWVAFHDINPKANLRGGVSTPDCQAFRFWMETFKDREKIEIIQQSPPGPGIGIIIV